MNENEFVEMIMTGNLEKHINLYKTNIIKHNFQKIHSVLSKNNISLYVDKNQYLRKSTSKHDKLYLDSYNNVLNLLNIAKDRQNINTINALLIILNCLYKNGFCIKFNYKKTANPGQHSEPQYSEEQPAKLTYINKYNLHQIINEIDSIEIIFNYRYNGEQYFIVDAFTTPIIISLD